MNCPEKRAPEHGNQQESEKDPDSVIFYGLESGFVVVFWVVFCVLLFKKAWRVAYFSLVDLVYDKLNVFVVVIWCIL
jgi:hypothetical protein